MARVSLSPPRTLTYRLAEWYSRRTYGAVLDPLKAMGHHPRLLIADARFEMAVAKWKELDRSLKDLAEMATAARIGCSWCMDFGYWLSHTHGLPEEKLRAVPRWREHRELFSETELAVLEYAEAMTETEPTVTDELAQRLVGLLGELAFVELTAMVAVENLRSRINSALGLTGQGFSDRCALPSHA